MKDFKVSLINEVNNTVFEKYIITSPSLKEAKKGVKIYLKNTLFSSPTNFIIKPLPQKMNTKEFKKGTLIFSGSTENKTDLEQKISKRIYYNSKINLTMFLENRGIKFFYLVNSKGEIQQKKVVRLDTKSNFQYRYIN